jgi:hypothetical protein
LCNGVYANLTPVLAGEERKKCGYTGFGGAAIMQINVRFGAGTFVGAAVLCAVLFGIWKVEHLSRILPKWIVGEHEVRTEISESKETHFIPTDGGYLEVARIKAFERFTRTDSRTIAGINLGTTTSEIEVAALFRYQIAMEKRWPIECSIAKCIVRAAVVSASPPAAIYSDEMRKRTEAGWARFNKDDNLAALEKQLTQELDKRASRPANIAAATEEARRTVAKFVQTWLVSSGTSVGAKPPEIVVLFPGESPVPAP